MDPSATDDAEGATWYEDQSMADDECQQIEQMLAEYGQINTGTRAMLNRMNQAERMLHTSGALEPPDTQMHHGVQNIVQGGETSSAQWKDLLLQAHKKVLEDEEVKVKSKTLIQQVAYQ